MADVGDAVAVEVEQEAEHAVDLAVGAELVEAVGAGRVEVAGEDVVGYLAELEATGRGW